MKKAVQEALCNKDTLGMLANLIQEEVTKTVVEQLKDTIDFNTAVIQDLKLALEEKDKKIKDLQIELQDKTDALEQYQRRQCLRVFGIQETPSENTDNIVIEVAKEIGVDLKVEDIDRSHRVGKGDNGRPRPIIVKFISYRKRNEMFTNKKKLKGTRKTIREDLTPARLQLLQKAIAKFGVRSVWSRDGIIYIHNGGRKIPVTNGRELENIREP